MKWQRRIAVEWLWLVGSVAAGLAVAFPVAATTANWEIVPGVIVLYPTSLLIRSTIVAVRALRGTAANRVPWKTRFAAEWLWLAGTLTTAAIVGGAIASQQLSHGAREEVWFGVFAASYPLVMLVRSSVWAVRTLTRATPHHARPENPLPSGTSVALPSPPLPTPPRPFANPQSEIQPVSASIPTEALRRYQSRSYFFRHWSGNLPLRVAFWANGVAVNVLFLVVLNIVIIFHESVKIEHLVVLSFLFSVTVAAATIWQTVGIWRSGKHYLGEQLWVLLSRCCTIVAIVRAGFVVTDLFIPQAIQCYNVVQAEKRLPPFTVTILPGETALEFRGGIRGGAASELRRVLNTCRTARILHINSTGGRLREARAMAQIVREHGLITFVSEQCASAATLVFIAGHERFIVKEKTLGFHAAYLSGVSLQKHADANEEIRRDMASAGIERTFITKAIATPHTELWYPTVEELLLARVVMPMPSPFPFPSGALIAESDPQRTIVDVVGVGEFQFPGSLSATAISNVLVSRFSNTSSAAGHQFR